MSSLCLSVRLLQPYAHGRDEYGGPEWPPSPLRMVQALVAASAGRWNERRTLTHALPALRWLEALPAPMIVAPRAVRAEHGHRLHVPNNVTDKVAASWCRGRDASIADFRTEKDVRPSYLDSDTVYYLYHLPDVPCPHPDTLAAAARAITHLGWGIDMAVGDARLISGDEVALLPGLRWIPSPRDGTSLRVPRAGTIDDLIRKHDDFLHRLGDDGFHPVSPLRAFDIVRYRCQDQPLQRPYRVFELRRTDGARSRYSHRRFIHIAGMVRHLAIETMKIQPPRGVAGDWLATYVAGHRGNGPADANEGHRQFSYVPLPSVGHEHADPGIRRVMIVAPIGDDDWLDHLARRLAGQPLQPLRGDEFPVNDPPVLVPVPRSGDGVVRCYTSPASVWHSFTPAILPGHDDHDAQKTRGLVAKALRHSGIETPCDFEWSACSRFGRSYSAHKYGKDGQPQGYFRPDYLQSQTAVHLMLRFHDGTSDRRAVEVSGPLLVGAGRHCGFGLMVAEQGATSC